MASISEIAKLANVSKMTVSNVINKKFSKVSEETREKIEKIIKETNYTPNLFARSLKSNKSKIILLAIPQTLKNDPNKDKAFENPFYGEMINSIEYHLRKLGYYLMFRFVSEDEVVSQLVVNWNLDGVIVLGATEDEVKHIFNHIPVPCVFVDTYTKNLNLNTIISDDEKGGYLATNYLINKGYKKIGVVVSEMGNKGVSTQRFKGYKRALFEQSMVYKDEYLFEGYPSVEFGQQIGHKIKNNLEAYDALFVYSDMLAIGVIDGLKKHGIKIPEDIAVVGFDGLYIGELCEPKLTTIKQDITLKGEKAVEVLVDLLNIRSDIEKTVNLDVVLIEKKSA